MSKLKDEFGFLPVPVKIEFGNYILKPKRGFKTLLKNSSKAINVDGFIYPFSVFTVRYTDLILKKGIKVNNSEKPADIFRLPPTHTIETKNKKPLPKNFREEDGAFILGLLGLLYDSRLQFWDWWFEGRISAKGKQITLIRNGGELNFGGNRIPLPDELSELFTNAYKKWVDLPASEKECLLNALYFHLKATSYLWGSERFIANYIASDAIWKLGQLGGKWGHKSTGKIQHRERIRKMCEVFGIHKKQMFPGQAKHDPVYYSNYKNEVLNLVTTRNDLFHEGKWGDGNPLSSTFNKMVVFKIHEMIKKMILSTLGVNNTWTRAEWYNRGSVMWDGK